MAHDAAMGERGPIREGEGLGLGIYMPSAVKPSSQNDDEDDGYKSDETIKPDDKRLFKKDRTTYDANDTHDPNKTPKPLRKMKKFLKFKEGEGK